MQQRAQTGFTLIELLTVVSIVALLVALLLPSLGRARSAARRVGCQSNLKQLNVAMTIYVQANRGYVMPGWMTTTAAPPPGGFLFGGGQDISWQEQIKFTIGNFADVGVWNCPTGPYGGDRRVVFGNYGVNRHVAGPAQGGWYLDTPMQLSAIKHPSRVALLFDAGGYLIAQVTAQNPAYAYWYLPGYNPGAVAMYTDVFTADSLTGRHDGRVNIAAVDGHVMNASSMEFAFNNDRWVP